MLICVYCYTLCFTNTHSMCILSLAGAATGIIFVVTKVLLWQAYFCHDNTCLSQQNMSFVTTKVCLPQQNFCRDKIMFCHEKHMQKLTCQDKTFVRTILCLLQQMFVWTKLLSQQKYVCRDKRFITRSILLSQQKTCFVVTNTYTCLSRQTHVCHDKTVFMTKGYLWQLPPVIVYTTHDKTDGLFQASSLPLSIIIVGVGDADFEGQYCHKLFLLFLYWFMSCLSVALRPQKP